MAIRIIKTHEEEAEKIINDRLNFIIRTDRDFYKENDIIQFMVMKQGKPVNRSITGKSFLVTAVVDAQSAPVVKGHQLINFRRLK